VSAFAYNYVFTTDDNWVNQYKAENVPLVPLAPADHLECEWASEFLRGGSTADENHSDQDHLKQIASDEEKRLVFPYITLIKYLGLFLP
jgi:hypothetical protein